MIKVLLYSFKAVPIAFMMILIPCPSRNYWYNKLDKITDKILEDL